MTARSALHAVVQHASDADEAEFNRRLDVYAAEVRGAALQDAKAETVALEQEVAELTRRLAEVRAEVLRVATAIDGIDFHPRAVVRSLEAAAGLARRLRRLADDTDIEPCDDCPGRPDCRCADGHTDPTTCTCGPGWFARRAATETDPARRAAWRMLARLEGQ